MQRYQSSLSVVFHSNKEFSMPMKSTHIPHRHRGNGWDPPSGRMEVQAKQLLLSSGLKSQHNKNNRRQTITIVAVKYVHVNSNTGAAAVLLSI